MIAKLCCVQIFSGRSRSPKLVFAPSADFYQPTRYRSPCRAASGFPGPAAQNAVRIGCGGGVDAARHLRRPTARRVDANNALTWAFAWCPHRSSNLGPRDYHWRVPGRLGFACRLVQQQF